MSVNASDLWHVSISLHKGCIVIELGFFFRVNLKETRVELFFFFDDKFNRTRRAGIEASVFQSRILVSSLPESTYCASPVKHTAKILKIEN